MIPSYPHSDAHGDRPRRVDRWLIATCVSGVPCFTRALCLLAAACSLGVGLPLAVAADPEPLTVMTWNLEWFYDDDSGDNFSKLAKEKSAPDRSQWDWRRDAVARGIAKTRPTVAAFQEVENRRVLWYLSRAIDRNHSISYRELAIQSRDHFTEQDVGMLFRQPADVLLASQLFLPSRMRKAEKFSDVTKHLLAEFEFPVGNGTERITVLNVHLRSGVQGESMRRAGQADSSLDRRCD